MDKHWTGVVPVENIDVRVHVTKTTNSKGIVLEWYGIGAPVNEVDKERLLEILNNRPVVKTLIGKIRVREVNILEKPFSFVFDGLEKPEF